MLPNFVSKSIKRRLLWILAPVFFLVGCNHGSKVDVPDDRWVELMDGETLNGWTQVNGTAPYDVIDGAIRGTNVLDSPNSFLATDLVYSDFVIEFESRSIGDANSGVQFRTAPAPGSWSGVIGYQLDIDPTERRWTGGIYHEGVHVWRHSMARNIDCQAAYNHGQWNKYRIEAVGPVIATWVNDIACSHMVGDHHETGFIALQVHSIGQDTNYLGSHTDWRGLRLLENPAQSDLWLARRNDLVEGWLENEISEIESENGWRSVNPANGATVFDVPNDSFEFVMDMQVGASAEGRLNYALAEKDGTCLGAYKILDDSSLAEARSEMDHMGSVPAKRASENLSEPGRPKRFYSADRWNRVRIVVTAETIEHWLNSVKVIEYARCSPRLTSVTSVIEAPKSNQNRLQIVTEQGVVAIRNAKFRAISNSSRPNE